MKVAYHPVVQRDVFNILRHYESINDHLGGEFWEELNSFISTAAANPNRFHFERPNLRRKLSVPLFPDGLLK
jgi:hypothetical protein